jgi:hypothetical protein
MGLALLIVVLKALALLTEDDAFNNAARFWARIFAINFAMGVVTGIPMEFQFGTNWAAFSKTAGGVIGQMLGMEGVFSFFLESLDSSWDCVGSFPAWLSRSDIQLWCIVVSPGKWHNTTRTASCAPSSPERRLVSVDRCDNSESDSYSVPHPPVLRKIESAREMKELAVRGLQDVQPIREASKLVRNLRTMVSDGVSFIAGLWRRRAALAAENLFLRKQLALFRDREKKAMPTTPADRPRGLRAPECRPGDQRSAR